jgi:hypothetical protein
MAISLMLWKHYNNYCCMAWKNNTPPYWSKEENWVY